MGELEGSLREGRRWTRKIDLRACKIQDICRYVRKIIFVNTGSTKLITDVHSCTKQDIPVVGVMFKTCGGALAHSFRKFHFVYHILSHQTACCRPVSVCRSITPGGK